MAPEMAAGDNRAIGPRSDVYLLGAVLYEILTGLRPHQGDSLEASLLLAANNTILPSPSDHGLLPVARQAMAADPSQRFDEVAGFAEAIRDWQRHGESQILVDQGEKLLERARQEQDVEAYSRATFCGDQALELWPGNPRADRLLRDCAHDHAYVVLERGDHQGARTILDHAGIFDGAWAERIDGVIRQARAAQRQRKRSALTLVGLAGVVAVLLTVGIVDWLQRQEGWETVLDVQFDRLDGPPGAWPCMTA
jgi:hypothetical protein